MKRAAMWAAILALGCDGGGMTTNQTVDSKAPTGSVTPGDCRLHTSTRVAPDGTKIESRTYFASFDGIQPGDDFAIVTCGFTFTSVPASSGATCPTGYTCTEGGDPLPIGPSTCAQTSNYTFYPSGVLANCGTGTLNYDASGTLKNESDYHYADVKLYRR